MTAQILPFPSGSAACSPVAAFLRIGDAHKRFADIVAGGVPAQRVVVEGSRLKHQKESLASLKAAGAEIVLDTEAAELASPRKHVGHAAKSPWALPAGAGPVSFQVWSGPRRHDILRQIAETAVTAGADVVLAPAHFLAGDDARRWLLLDAGLCRDLRTALDRVGGSFIAIDYPLIVSREVLADANLRGAILAGVGALPIDNVWLRLANFGADATPAAVVRYLGLAKGLHNLGKPLVGDHLGGLPGMAALAFGSLAGIALGLTDQQRFDASGWFQEREPKPEGAAFGRKTRIAPTGLFKSLTPGEITLLAEARAGARLCGCNDRACCPHGLKDLLQDPRRHAARQLTSSLAALERVPDLRRPSYFVGEPLAKVRRTARQVSCLRPSATDAAAAGIDVPALMKRLVDHADQVDRLGEALHQYEERDGRSMPRAVAARWRGGAGSAEDGRGA